MRAKIYLKSKDGKHEIFDGVLMNLDGEKDSLADLEKAARDIKAVCNGEANRFGLRLSDCDIRIKFV